MGKGRGRGGTAAGGDLIPRRWGIIHHIVLLNPAIKHNGSGSLESSVKEEENWPDQSLS
jgi:hypothetical protein